VLVCYNNCPNSNEKPPVQNTVTSYCNAALPLRPAASASAASVASAAKTQSRYTASPSATGSAAAASGTGSAAEATPTVAGFTGGAGVKGVSVGVLLGALVAGLF